MEERVLEGGLFFIVGPAGSGKTTMAYSWLNKLNDIKRALATVEDTPSYSYGGLIQTYYNGRAASEVAPGIIRNLREQHIDVLYVDDVSDGATLDAVLDAAECGILTFASLTAPSLPHAIKRLLHLGASPGRLSASLSGILFKVRGGQICPDCREAVPFDSRQLAMLETLFGPTRNWDYNLVQPLLELTTTYRGVGCDTCHGRGVLGQTGLFGYADFDEEARRLLQAGNLAEIKRVMEFGMAYYLERGARAALWEGRVSLEELQNVLRPVVAAARRVV